MCQPVHLEQAQRLEFKRERRGAQQAQRLEFERERKQSTASSETQI